MFKRDPNAKTSGGSLCGYLDTVSDEDMVRAFGKPDDGTDDSDNGYNGREWRFSDAESHTLYVYSRHGSFRIGAEEACRKQSHDFKSWLLGQIEAAS